MNFQELKERTLDGLSEVRLLRETSNFVDFCRRLQSLHQKYFNEAKKENLSLPGFQNIHKGFVNGVRTVVQNADLGNIFVDLQRFRDSTSSVASELSLLMPGARDLRGELGSLWNELNDLMRNPSNFALIVTVINRCEKVEKNLEFFDNCYQFLTLTESLLDNKQVPREKEAGLELDFGREIETLAELSLRLDCLQMVYAEVCLIFAVNEKTHPLRLSKVESGSLWTRVFGEGKVIEFLVWFFTNSIRFLHRNYTNEGKLEHIPVKVEALEAQLGFLAKLREMLPEDRYNTLANKPAETLAKASYMLAKQTQALFEREAKLKINGEELKLEHPYDTKYLDAVRKQLPEHSSFTPVDPHSEGPPPHVVSGEDDLSKDEPQNN